MKTVGELLKDQRLKIKLSISEVSKLTKIQENYLKALENNDLKNLPAATFVKGFIRNYSKSIESDPKTMLAVFRRDFDQDKKGRIIPRSMIEPIEKKINITPKTTSVFIFGLLAAVLATLFIRQIIFFYKGPEINIESPKSGQTVTSPVEVKGSSSSDSSVLVNNQSTNSDQSGNFSTQVQLSPGEHTITITATDRSGKTHTIQTSVIVSP
ncbi:helix-turn-helix domain-containing protein [Patescibacteria group bacterium]